MNAVITGASRGIGKAVARLFALNGYDLFLASRTEQVLLQAMEELRTEFPNITVNGLAMDLSTKAGAELFGQWVQKEAGTVDVLVNNAGTFTPGNISDEPDGALEHMLGVNLFSAYYLTRTLLPRMIGERSGHIFNICSIASLHAYPGGGAYSISKFALLGFSRNLRRELEPHGVKVTAVLPGAVYTDSWNGSGVAPERIMEADDIAKLIFAATQLSPQAVPDEILVRPQQGDL